MIFVNFPEFFSTIFPIFFDFSTICFCHKNINFHNKNCDKTNSTFRRSWRYEKQENRVEHSGSTEIFSMFMILTSSLQYRETAKRGKSGTAMIDDSIKRANNSTKTENINIVTTFFQEVESSKTIPKSRRSFLFLFSLG